MTESFLNQLRDRLTQVRDVPRWDEALCSEEARSPEPWRRILTVNWRAVGASEIDSAVAAVGTEHGRVTHEDTAVLIELGDRAVRIGPTFLELHAAAAAGSWPSSVGAGFQDAVLSFVKEKMAGRIHEAALHRKVSCPFRESEEVYEGKNAESYLDALLRSNVRVLGVSEVPAPNEGGPAPRVLLRFEGRSEFTSTARHGVASEPSWVPCGEYTVRATVLTSSFRQYGCRVLPEKATPLWTSSAMPLSFTESGSHTITISIAPEDLELRDNEMMELSAGGLNFARPRIVLRLRVATLGDPRG